MKTNKLGQLEYYDIDLSKVFDDQEKNNDR